MPALTGATEIGGIVIPVGLGLTALSAEITKLNAMVAAIEKPRQLNLTANAASLAQAKQSLTEIYQLKPISVAPLRAVEQAIRDVTTTARTEGEKTGRALAEGVERGIKGHASAGGGGHGHGSLARKNLLSARGLEGLGVGGSATAAFAMIEALHIAGEMAQASEISSHPERIAREFMAPGSTLDLGMVREQSKVIAEAQASQKRLEAVSSIPILGNLVRLGTVSYEGELRDKEFEAKEAIQAHEFTRKAGVANDIKEAQLHGDKLAEMSRTQDDARKPLENSVKKFLTTDVGGFTVGGLRSRGFEPSSLSGPNVDKLIELANKADKDQRELDRLKANQTKEASQLRTQIEADRGTLTAHAQAIGIGTGALGLRGEATSILTQGGVGGAAFARSKQVEAEYETNRAAMIENAQAVKNLEDKNKKGGLLPEDYAAQRSVLDAQGKDLAEKRRQIAIDSGKAEIDVQRSTDATIAANEAHSRSARLTYDRQFYAAKMSDLNAANKAELMALGNQGASFFLIASTIKKQFIGGLIEANTHNRDVTEFVGTSGIAATANLQRAASGFFMDPTMAHNADMSVTMRQQQMALEQIKDPQMKAAQAWQNQTQNFQSNFGFALDRSRSLASQGLQIQARTSAAILEQQDEPIAAQMTMAVAAAQAAVRAADPTQIAAVREEQKQILQAKRHQLFDPHSGGYAAMGSAVFIPGDPLGLTKHAQDLKAAGDILNKGENSLKDMKPQDITNLLNQIFGQTGALNWLGTLIGNAAGGLVQNGTGN